MTNGEKKELSTKNTENLEFCMGRALKLMLMCINKILAGTNKLINYI